jgi:cbb3-type cytochrome oxidase subunit 3
MRLSDIMSHAGLAFYAEAGLILFLGVFAAVAWHVLRPGSRSLEKHGRIPLDGD